MPLRVHPNPNLQMSSPIFLPSDEALELSKKQKQPPKWIQGSKGRLQHDGKVTCRHQHRNMHCFLPPDIFADFDMNIEPDVISSDISDYAHLFDDDDVNDVYDLCPQTMDKDTQVSTSGFRCVSNICPKGRHRDCPVM